jgi:signal transduction histidine kinase
MLPTAAFPSHDWLTLVACVGPLALAVIAMARAATSPLALPLAWLSVGLFSWNFATLAHTVSGAPEWRYLDVAFSPLTIPLTLNFMTCFVGRRRAHRHVLTAAWLLFGLLALASLSALVWSPMRAFAGSPAWAGLCLVGAISSVVYTVWLLVAHYRGTPQVDERQRTRLVIVALVIGAALSVTELLADLGVPVPRTGNLGALFAVVVLAVVALRFRLLEDSLPKRVVVYAVALGVLSVVAYLAVFQLFRSQVAIVVCGTITITLALLAGVVRLVMSHARERERLRRLASLGRLSAQMAHDLKNPIAALKGAIQFLQAELDDEPEAAQRAELLRIAVQQVDRLGAVVDRYHRLGRLETLREPVCVNDLVETVVRAQAMDRGDGVDVESALGDAMPRCPADGELVTRAIDNLVRNAREASAQGSRVVVATERATAPDGRPCVSVVVRDRGRGLEPRAAERAFDDFFTTKTHGSGMGLFFVKRVAEVHGGDATLSSTRGRGTEARLLLPVAG